MSKARIAHIAQQAENGDIDLHAHMGLWLRHRARSCLLPGRFGRCCVRPSGFTKLGFPIVYFPDCAAFSDVLESDLHLLFKYYLSVVPRTEQQGRYSVLS